MTEKEELEGRKLALVDNRIVAGNSSWIVGDQPITICVLHPKQNKPRHRKLIEEVLKIANQALIDAACKKPL